MARKASTMVAFATLGFALLTTPAHAASTPVTKMKLELDAHVVTAGASVTQGGVWVWTRSGDAWVPLDGVELTVRVDASDVRTAVTGADGYADVIVPAVQGEHVMKVVFPGDPAHAGAQRARGFRVTAGGSVRRATVPDAPVLLATSPSSGLVVLDWTLPASDGGSPISGYSVYRGDTSGAEIYLFTVPATTLSTNDISLPSGATLYYMVTAVNAVGESARSNEVPVTVT